jgi:hypothetical protein
MLGAGESGALGRWESPQGWESLGRWGETKVGAGRVQALGESQRWESPRLGESGALAL